ncbi:hypothetical protein M0811_10180 [Anaeramoeba ignava]|uniref:Uncharacterized protein n=1 Tax=Anaeramoeba ignava TaxID=1746090 RepID=A0A9Q0R9L9_ANAIG|nr:hypothetical protein M0811_10180 [Anaeramoeba ignava]
MSKRGVQVDWDSPNEDDRYDYRTPPKIETYDKDQWTEIFDKTPFQILHEYCVGNNFAPPQAKNPRKVNFGFAVEIYMPHLKRSFIAKERPNKVSAKHETALMILNEMNIDLEYWGNEK